MSINSSAFYDIHVLYNSDKKQTGQLNGVSIIVNGLNPGVSVICLA